MVCLLVDRSVVLVVILPGFFLPVAVELFVVESKAPNRNSWVYTDPPVRLLARSGAVFRKRAYIRDFPRFVHTNIRPELTGLHRPASVHSPLRWIVFRKRTYIRDLSLFISSVHEV